MVDCDDVRRQSDDLLYRYHSIRYGVSGRRGGREPDERRYDGSGSHGDIHCRPFARPWTDRGNILTKAAAASAFIGNASLVIRRRLPTSGWSGDPVRGESRTMTRAGSRTGTSGAFH